MDLRERAKPGEHRISTRSREGRGRVVIFGAGIGGLSAAQELVERGFIVEVYERASVCGGKARSFSSPHGPAEHGLRFFPGFYHHLDDTMSRIPYGFNKRGVLDNLCEATEALFLSEEGKPVRMLARAPRHLGELPRFVRSLWSQTVDLDMPLWELALAARRWGALQASCEARQRREFETLSWTQMMTQGRPCSAAYDRFFLNGWARTFAALEPELANARTMGLTFVQMLRHVYLPGKAADRVLNGPTSEVFIGPWVRELKRRGVRFVMGAGLRELHGDPGGIRHATVADARGELAKVEADAYVVAVPVEVMQRILTPQIKALAPSLSRLDQLVTQFMGGIQYYIAPDLPIAHGHVHYADAAWALTSISQAQFWPQGLLEARGDGQVKGVLSASIGDWRRPGNKTTSKPAMDCTAEEIAREVWAQMEAHFDPPLRRALGKVRRLGWSIDPRIRKVEGRWEGAEPLLMNTVDSWRHRPEASTELANLFLASDYVRTDMDFASMESANEAARRAVNGLLDRLATAEVPRCRLWRHYDIPLFAPLKLVDRLRYRLGLPGWAGHGARGLAFEAEPTPVQAAGESS